MPQHDGDTCRVCGAESAYIWTGQLIGQNVKYYECPRCAYVQTERPTWLDAAYAEAINVTDTGIMFRNLNNVDIVVATLWTLGDLRGRVVDLAGGYGILVRLLRDVGIDALWADLHSTNLLARGFEFDDESVEPVKLVTAFEALEHFVNPEAEIARMFAISSNVLCSTELMPIPTPRQDQWWYYGREHGQHIGFFRLSTLEFLANRFNKRIASDGRMVHFFTDVPVSPTYWHLLRKIRRLLRWGVRLKVRSKTWSDHDLLAKHQLDT